MSPLYQQLQHIYAEGHAKAPPGLWIDPRIHAIARFTPAAVLIAITDRADTPGMLLIHRPDTMRAHPGQIAFPGGRRDQGEDAITAALREAEEELGIPPHNVQIIGPTDIYRTGSGYEITPVIAVVPPDLPLAPNPDEVSAWFEAPLAHMLDGAHHQIQHVEVDGQCHPFIEIGWQGHRVWGVTAAIIANLARRLEGVVPHG